MCEQNYQRQQDLFFNQQFNPTNPFALKNMLVIKQIHKRRSKLEKNILLWFMAQFQFLIYKMKKFEEGLKEKAHLSKIRQAKTSLVSSTKTSSKLTSSKIGVEAQLLLDLYDKKSYDSIPAYKLLRTAGLQQYTREFIQRGYGINLGKLALINADQKKKLYQEIKILPGHTVKLDRIIQTLAKSSYNLQANESVDTKSEVGTEQESSKLKIIEKKDINYEKQLERVMNQYTPQSNDQKKKTFNSKYSEKKSTQLPPNNETRYIKTKYSTSNRDKSIDFKKKPAVETSKPTVKKVMQPEQAKRQSLARLLKTMQHPTTNKSMSSKKVMQINLQIDKVKSLNRSFDGALMSSTIANIDIEELVYAFSGFVASKVIAAPEPKTHFESVERQSKSNENDDDIEDQVGQILKQSFLHPLYKNQQVEEELVCEQDAYSQGEEEDLQTASPHKNEFTQDKMMESSFLGGTSVDFGLVQPLKIFDEPQPTAIDYFKPTIDSVSNFIKNIVLTAKMEREIPIMAAAYLESFTEKVKLQLTSLNYKRVLVCVLLLASKIWDDQSFETPSFSKTFPQYSTVLLNEMEKQVVKALDYKLKIDKREYTTIYFKMRRHTKQNIKSYQNRKLTMKRVRQLQSGQRKDYKSHFMTKRNSY